MRVISYTLCILYLALSSDAFDLSIFGKYKFKCSTAMVCIDEVMCDQFGVMSKTPVILSAEQELFRHPVLPCKKKDGGDGVCCRDPDFRDDWPANWVDPVYKPWSPKPTVVTEPTPARPNSGRAPPPSSTVVKSPTNTPIQSVTLTRPIGVINSPSPSQQQPKPGSIQLTPTVTSFKSVQESASSRPVNSPQFVSGVTEATRVTQSTQGRSRNIDIEAIPEPIPTKPQQKTLYDDSQSEASVFSSGGATINGGRESTVLKDISSGRSIYISPSMPAGGATINGGRESTVLKDISSGRSIQITPSKSNVVTIETKKPVTSGITSSVITQKVVPLAPVNVQEISATATSSNFPTKTGTNYISSSIYTSATDGQTHSSATHVPSIEPQEITHIDDTYVPELIIRPRPTRPSIGGTTVFQDRSYLPTGSGRIDVTTENPSIFLGPLEAPSLNIRKSAEDIIKFFATETPEISQVNPATDSKIIYFKLPQPDISSYVRSSFEPETVQPVGLEKGSTLSAVTGTQVITASKPPFIINVPSPIESSSVQTQRPIGASVVSLNPVTVTPTLVKQDPCSMQGSTGSYDFKFSAANCRMPNVVVKTENPSVGTVVVNSNRPTQGVSTLQSVVPVEVTTEVAPVTTTEEDIYDPDILPILLTGCPRRNRTARPDVNPKAPYSSDDYDSGAGEFPWQAAVLDRNGQLLCGCYFTEEDTCTTFAGCVAGLKPSDITLAIGAYDLTDLRGVREPTGGYKGAEITTCEAIEVDKTQDIAMLFIKDIIDLNYYKLPICIDRQRGIPFVDYDDCVVTGWGFNSTRTNHWFDVKLQTTSACSGSVPGFDPSRQSCGRLTEAASVDLCNFIELGNGFQCRYLGDRKSRDNEIYWLKGVISACLPDTQTVVYNHLNIKWFEKSLNSHRSKRLKHMMRARYYKERNFV